MTTPSTAPPRRESRVVLASLGRQVLSPGWRQRLPGSLRSARPALLLFLAARAASLLVLVVLSRNTDSLTYGIHRLAVHWDAAWYLGIAQHGYDHAIHPVMANGDTRLSNLAFFPLYPALIKLTRIVTLGLVPWGVCGLLVAGVSSLVAAWGIYAVTATVYGRRAGTLAAVLWGITPVAVAESAAYSESSFTALAAWALYATVKRRWLAAGTLSVLAGLTRPTGIAVGAAVLAAAALEVWTRLRGSRLRRDLPLPGGKDRARPAPSPGDGLWRPVTGGLIAPLGWVGFVAWTALRLHRWDAYFKIQDAWNSRFDFGRTTISRFETLFTQGAAVNLFYPAVSIMLMAAVVLLVVTIVQRQPLPFVVFSAVVLAIALGDTAHFSSHARFLLPAFPLLLPFATALARLRNRPALVTLLASATAISAAYGTYIMLYSPGAP